MHSIQKDWYTIFFIIISAINASCCMEKRSEQTGFALLPKELMIVSPYLISDDFKTTLQQLLHYCLSMEQMINT
jgi:hypothetical protein